MVIGGTAVAYLDARQRALTTADQRVTGVAETLAETPTVRAALDLPEPSRVLQPYADRVRAQTGVDFITIMTPSGMRYTHPNPALIGKPFLGHIGPAQRGTTFTETYAGSLGPSLRVVTPIMEAGRVRGLISVGITLDAIGRDLRGRVIALVEVAALALLLGAAGTYVINLRLRRATHGLGPTELSRMYEYHDAMVHAVREGLILLDQERRMTLCNDGARHLLGLPAQADDRPVTELGLPPGLTQALLDDQPRRDEIHVTDDRVLVINTSPAESDGRRVGTAVTLRDQTELRALMGELNTTRSLTESLRSQAHESANRLHTIVSLIELGRADDAVRFATAELESAQQLTDLVVGAVTEPVIAALLLGKTAEASERGVELLITPDTEVGPGVQLADLEPRDLVTILGNLVDNAIDAAAGREPAQVQVTVRNDGSELTLRVADSGPGLDPTMLGDAFQRGWSTKSGDPLVGRGLGLALVGQAVRRQHGQIEVTRGDYGGAAFTVRLPLSDRDGNGGEAGGDGRQTVRPVVRQEEP